MNKVLNRKVAIVSVGVLLLLSVILLTYALWSRSFTQTGTNTISTDCFNIEYSQTDAVTLNNAYPQTDADGLKNVPYTITIENTCDTIATYEVLLNELSTSTLLESNVKVAVNDNYKMLNAYESATPSESIENASSARKLLFGILPGNSTKTISIKSWMDENTTEVQGENKTFAYKITIETSAGTQNLLAAEILKTPLTTTAIDYSALPVSGLYAANDNDGESYFYRGNIDNNYVDLNLTYPTNIGVYFVGLHGRNIQVYSFSTYEAAESSCESSYNSLYNYTSIEECITDIQDYSIHAGDKMLFRIVRVNGDGTIRLITDGQIEYSIYNTSNNLKSVGYTYDNSKICTNASSCDGTEGTSSTIKSVLDNWYLGNIALTNLNNKIAVTTYCNDTTYTTSASSYGGTNYKFGSPARMSSGTPSLICPDTTVTYGGVYKLKVGLPSADEIRMAGYGLASTGSYSIWSNYMYSPNSFWSLSPISCTSVGGIVVYVAKNMGYINADSLYTVSGNGVRPVINLVSDAKITSGNGTKANPYVISTD